MSDDSDVRKTEILQEYNNWLEIKFENLKKGDVFRLHEKTGELIYDKLGNSQFTAISDVYTDGQSGIYGISTDGTFI
ncbi:MAG: hypothetical protein KQ78_01205 [Candidatus Izimaplasma bacterium HR2]|nr:MAG: hypothetical protein KQ78_01205 [Candidatus Izimaplasma bacterium HR2]